MSDALDDTKEAGWPLPRAVDALRDAARIAGRPSWLWLAGFAYPGLNLGLSTVWRLMLLDEEAFSGGADGPGFTLPLAVLAKPGSLVFLIVILPLYSRLTAGLARLATREHGDLEGSRPGLRSAWRAGVGTTQGTFGMWILLAVLFLIAAAAVWSVVAIALKLVESLGGGDALYWLAFALAAPAIALLAVYAAVISVVQQLGLHSLAHNRRGVGSALVHAWRIARQDPRATARTVALDAVLQAFIFAIWIALTIVTAVLSIPAGGWLVVLLGICMGGFAGVTRALFWARAYRALGGLTPEDGVPGLGHA